MRVDLRILTGRLVGKWVKDAGREVGKVGKDANPPRCAACIVHTLNVDSEVSPVVHKIMPFNWIMPPAPPLDPLNATQTQSSQKIELNCILLLTGVIARKVIDNSSLFPWKIKCGCCFR
jgi:hypothetical protein